ncbi:MAG: peroxiredoxin, partial [Bacteroidales bacterium]
MENEEMNMNPMLRIGDKAPDFVATTTTGKIKFSEYNKGNWVVLFSHPADFTPVCTTEMSGFAQRKSEFDELNTKLMGLSIDSIHSHLAWVNNVKKNTGVYFDFPIIADIDMKVSKLYGMLQPNEAETAAVRAVYFIDPKGKIRLIMYYELGEVERAADSLSRAVSLDPEDPQAHYRLGVILEELKSYEEALSEYRAASALVPDRAVYCRQAGSVLHR